MCLHVCAYGPGQSKYFVFLVPVSASPFLPVPDLNTCPVGRSWGRPLLVCCSKTPAQSTVAESVHPSCTTSLWTLLTSLPGLREAVLRCWGYSHSQHSLTCPDRSHPLHLYCHQVDICIIYFLVLFSLTDVFSPDIFWSCVNLYVV